MHRFLFILPSFLLSCQTHVIPKQRESLLIDGFSCDDVENNLTVIELYDNQFTVDTTEFYIATWTEDLRIGVKMQSKLDSSWVILNRSVEGLPVTFNFSEECRIMVEREPELEIVFVDSLKIKGQMTYVLITESQELNTTSAFFFQPGIKTDKSVLLIENLESTDIKERICKYEKLIIENLQPD